eukprot:767645-Hanusia_phi.AAC.4
MSRVSTRCSSFHARSALQPGSVYTGSEGCADKRVSYPQSVFPVSLYLLDSLLSSLPASPSLVLLSHLEPWQPRIRCLQGLPSDSYDQGALQEQDCVRRQPARSVGGGGQAQRQGQDRHNPTATGPAQSLLLVAKPVTWWTGAGGETCQRLHPALLGSTCCCSCGSMSYTRDCQPPTPAAALASITATMIHKMPMSSHRRSAMQLYLTHFRM